MSSGSHHEQPPRLLLTSDERNTVDKKIYAFNELIKHQRANHPEVQREMGAFREALTFLKGNFQTAYEPELRIKINALLPPIERLQSYIIQAVFKNVKTVDSLLLQNKKDVIFKAPLPVRSNKMFIKKEKQMIQGKLKGIINLLSYPRGKDFRIKKFLLACEEVLEYLSDIMDENFDKEERDGIDALFEFIQKVEPIFVSFVVVGEDCDLTNLEQIFANNKIGPIEFMNL